MIQILKKTFLHSFFILTGLCISLNTFAQNIPEKCTDIMLQGFYWDSFNETSWDNLKKMAPEIGEHFDFIWLPPSGKGAYFYQVGNSNDVGYHPRYWSDQTSAWGYDHQLKSLISTLKSNGCKAIADIVVNHRFGLDDDKGVGNTNFCSFAEDDFGEFGKFKFTSAHICPDSRKYPSKFGCSATGNSDTGSTWDGCPDLDHKSTYVQNAIKAYLKWLKKEYGYSGWRYDFVWGYGGQYLRDYNIASNPDFSVAEYWTQNASEIEQWIKASEYKSAVFDFPGKLVTIKEGVGDKRYSRMIFNDGQANRPTELVRKGYGRYSVTFVDNHDTYRESTKYTGNIPQAYAFILSSPGVPCVFWPHWTGYKTDINKMIEARKLVGIHSESDTRVTFAQDNQYYEAVTTGTKGSLICRIGSWSAAIPSGYSEACKGNGWAFYVKQSQGQAINLTVTPRGGSYSQEQTVAISASGTNAPFSIYYTLNGTNPSTNSTKYTQAIKINSSTTLKVIAQDAKGNISDVTEEKYIIGQNNSGYYVAGNGSFCNGFDWTSDGSMMSGNPASITFSNVASGSYKFKVTNGTWNDPVWGFASYIGNNSGVTGDSEDNILFTLNSTSNVTIVFNGENITAVTFGGGGSTPGGAYYVAGNGKSDSNGSFCNGFDWTSDGSLMVGNPASITFSNVAPGSYKFKVTNGTWNDPVWGFASYTGNNSGVTGDSEDNILFTLNSTSNVTIVFNGENITAVTFGGGGSTPGGAYYVAGNGKSDSNGSFCNGFDWTSDGSLMVGNPASITFSNVAPGSYKFKVTNGTWNDPVWGFASYTGNNSGVTGDSEDNILFTLSSTSNVTIVFNGENITAVTFGGGGSTPGGTYYVAGNGSNDSNGSFCNGQDWTTDVSLMSGNPASITFSNVAPGSYKFKVTNGTWNDPVWGFASYTGNNSGITSDSEDNILFTLNSISNVTIVFNGENITAVTFGNLTNINTIFGDEASVIGKEYYTLQGIKLHSEPTSGIFIVKLLKADGSTESQKMIK